MADSDVWVERYRPTHVKNVIMPDAYHKYFDGMVERGECQNILLYSSIPGSGKTSLAKAIVNDLGADCKYLNISAERGIDVLREDIAKFASTQSMFSDGKKIVIMDECDGATPVLQSALRAAIEEYEDCCRFILTCNYIEKIIPALREGRVQTFDFNFTNKEWREQLTRDMIKRLSMILVDRKVEYDPEAVELIVDKNFPSMRKMISILAKTSSLYGKITLENTTSLESIREKLYACFPEKDYTKAREILIQNSLDVSELYSQMFNEWVPKLPLEYQGAIIPILADYQYKHNFVIDQELNFTACMVDVMGVFRDEHRRS